MFYIVFSDWDFSFIMISGAKMQTTNDTIR